MSKARIAVVIGMHGDWSAYGGRGVDAAEAIDEAYGAVSDPSRVVWVEVDLPAPVAPPISAEIVDGDPESLSASQRIWDARYDALRKSLGQTH